MPQLQATDIPVLPEEGNSVRISFSLWRDYKGGGLEFGNFPTLRELSSTRQPDGCDLSWSAITAIKTDNVIVFQVVIWPVQLNPVNENLHLKEANFPAMS